MARLLDLRARAVNAAMCPLHITPKVLSERPEGLVERRLVTRLQIAAFPREASYGLTESGRQIVAILDRIEARASGPGDASPDPGIP